MLPPISLALADFSLPVPDGSDLFRTQCAFASQATYRAVQLNAAAPSLRPRELDRSARRDLAAFLRRSELACSGLDLWIPPNHFTDPTHADRAVAALLAAIELAADLDRLQRPTALLPSADCRCVCCTLPADLPSSIATDIATRATTCSVDIADFGAYVTPDQPAMPDPFTRGLDPASFFLASPITVAGVPTFPPRLAAARLTDASTLSRVKPGDRSGRLDVTAYAIALTTRSYTRCVVADLRGVPDTLDVARATPSMWTAALPTIS